jgi:hypothetical protein
MKNSILLIILIFFLSNRNAIGQHFVDFSTNEIVSTENISQIYKIMNQFTYSFCQTRNFTEFYHRKYNKEIFKRQLQIIGVFDSGGIQYSKKILLERVTGSYFNKNYSDSLTSYSIVKVNTFDFKLAYIFFSYLDQYKFHKLSDQCLLNSSFVDKSGNNVYIQINDGRREDILLLVRGKLRQIRCDNAETLFIEYPDQNSCRATFIICRNMFNDRIWNKVE